MSPRPSSQPPSSARARSAGSSAVSPDLERRLEAFLLIARRVGLS